MKSQIDGIKKEYQDLQNELNSPELVSNPQKMAQLGKRQAELTEVINVINELEKTEKNMRENAEIVNSEEDGEMKQMAMDENITLSEKKTQLEKDLEKILIPKDPNDSKNVIVEIRAGAGGDESALFAGNLFRMYSRFAEKQGWQTSVMDSNQIGIGGFKEVIFEINGRDVFAKMKYESGVHRVQRVPETEKAGRIHTSTATVAVLPEAAEVEHKIEEKDRHFLLIGAGRTVGQHDQKRRAHHSHPDRADRLLPRPKIPAQKQGQSDEDPALATRATGRRKIGQGTGRRPPEPDRHRRPQREDPHLQLSPGPRDRPPHQTELEQHPGNSGGQH